jgi:hypothetical protein
VAVEVQRRHGQRHVYLFDPKYKLEGELREGESTDGRSKKVDIDKMHAYRDAIRDQSYTRVVRYATSLYPGPERHYAEGLEAMSGYPGLEEPLEEKIGALIAKRWIPRLINSSRSFEPLACRLRLSERSCKSHC